MEPDLLRHTMWPVRCACTGVAEQEFRQASTKITDIGILTYLQVLSDHRSPTDARTMWPVGDIIVKLLTVKLQII